MKILQKKKKNLKRRTSSKETRWENKTKIKNQKKMKKNSP